MNNIKKNNYTPTEKNTQHWLKYVTFMEHTLQIIINNVYKNLN